MRSLQPPDGHLGRRDVGRSGSAWSVEHLKIDDRDPTARGRLRRLRLMGRCLYPEQSLRSAMQARGSSLSFRWQQNAAASAVHEQQSLACHT